MWNTEKVLALRTYREWKRGGWCRPDETELLAEGRTLYEGGWRLHEAPRQDAHFCDINLPRQGYVYIAFMPAGYWLGVEMHRAVGIYRIE